MRQRLFLLLCFFLVGCNVLTGERVECPKAVIVAEFLKTVHFQKEEPVFTEIDSLIPTCTREGDHTSMNLRLRFTSRRNLTKARRPLTITPSYFVAVVGPQGTILSRTDHEVELVFNEKESMVVNFQNLIETIPSPDVIVYVGFNLTEHQHMFFKKEREKLVIQRDKRE